MLVRRFVILMLLISVAVLLLQTLPGHTQQPQAGRNKGANPTKAQAAMPQNTRKGILGDTDRLFDTLALGGDTIAISDAGALQNSLLDFAKKKGIIGNRITREQFAQFGQQLKWQSILPEGYSTSQFNDDRNQMAEWDFSRRDLNGDGVLDYSEMEGALRNNLSQWDKNGDNVIDLREYRIFYRWKMGQRVAGGVARSFTQSAWHTHGPQMYVIPDIDELSTRPIAIRYGMLPDGLPAWFTELDTDGDGQVGLYEWRQSGKTIAEFMAMDRNGDGLLTAEEVLYYQDILGK